ncbi:MAG TPA: type VI secretion system baseplate subunit TssK [Gemmatimonadaceae bacterium]|nr:type VI secretion system baseplate subunit TssK [Gemmatimonadaceae bacterium]
MKQLSHIVWNEGMHLAQHHFQAQSRFFEDTVQFALTSLFFKPYGLVACELDAEALRNDTVSLVHARGIMPDGLPFDIPASDPSLNAVPIRDRFSPTSDSHLVLLAIPAYRPDQANFATNGAATMVEPTMRYVAESAVMRDDMTGRDERQLTVGRKSLRLVLDSDVAAVAGMVTLPIARVRRDGAGHFIYDPDYIAPSLHVSASPRLMALLHRLIEILESKADSITRGRRGSSDEFAQREVASFWLLHTIHASVPALRHCIQAKHIHPERVYVELARLAGGLSTFSLDAHPRMLPAYNHDEPEACFDALDRHVRSHLDIVAPTGRSAIPLTAAGQSLYACDIRDPRSFGPARWILGVRSSLPPTELAARMPALAKVCSKKFVLELVRRAFPGLKLDHVPYPPAAIAPRADTQYFSIERAGPCWDTIVSTQEVGVHVPDAIPNIELELSIVVDGEG